MKENVLDILMYMFEHCLDGESGMMPDEKHLRDQLDNAGFQGQDVDKAFHWLEGLSLARESSFDASLSDRAVRVHSSLECDKMDVECRGFLIFLEQTGVLDPITRELVIDRAMALEAEEIDLQELKWVILMVLFNQPGQEAALAWIEDLIFDDMSEHLH